MKKLVSLTSCALLLTSLFAGCSSGQSSNKTKNTAESFIYRTKDTDLINENESLIDINISNDNLILTKNKSNKLVELMSFDMEKGISQTHQFKCSDFSDNFGKSTEIFLDDENYYLFDIERGIPYLYTVNKENEEISCMDFPDKNIQKILAGKNDAVYILYNEYDIRKQHCYFEKYVNGKSVSKIDIADILSGGNMMDVNDIYIDDNENIFVLYTLNNTVYVARMNMNGEIAAKAAVDGIFGQMNRFVVSGDNTVFVVNHDESGEILLLNSIDNETCETTSMYEEKNCEIFNGYADYDYIIENDGEFSGVIAESGEHQKIDVNEAEYDLIHSCKNELTMFSIKYEYENILVKTDINAEGTASEYPIETGSNSYVVDSAYQNNRHIYLCENETGEFILFTDDEGKTIDTVQLERKDDARYIQVETDEEDNIYLVSTDSMSGLYQKYDKDMKLISEISAENIKGVNELLNINNELYSFNYDGVIYQVEFTNKKLAKKETELQITGIYSYDGKLLMMDNNGVVYMTDNDCITEIFSASELSEVGEYSISKILFGGLAKFYIYSNISKGVYIIDKVNVSEITDSKIINVAYDISSSEIRDVISKFNSENENVIVKLSDCSTDEKIEKLNIEIANGNVPDIIISDGRIDLSIYENLDALEDMSKFIEKDETIVSDDYYINIFKACSNNDKITQIVPFYSVITGFGKTSVLGNDIGWNYSEFLKTVSANKDKDILYKGLFNNEVSYVDAMYFALSSQIDFNNKKFEYNEDLIKVMSELKPYLEYKFDSDSNYDKNELSNDFDMRFRKDKILFDIANIRNIESVCNIKDGIINDEFIFKGIPSEEGIGSYVFPGLRIVMLNSCQEKDEAWKFIRQFLTDEYQEEQSMLYLPVKKSVLEKMYDKCEEKKIFINDEVCEIHKPSQQDKEMINEWLGSLNDSVISENRISSIICGELNRYINGEWNEEEALKEIKRKIEMYLSEV